MKQQRPDASTATKMLDVAEALVQTRGFNGFSYADVAAELRITKASLHYHYKGKAELGEALISRYTERFVEALGQISRSTPDAHARLERYVRIYADVLRHGRMCLCGMLAADYDTLSDEMRTAVVRFFDENERWLVAVLEEGAAAGTIHFKGSVDGVAQSILAGLEGALLLARPYGDVARFEAAALRLLEGLTGADPASFVRESR